MFASECCRRKWQCARHHSQQLRLAPTQESVPQQRGQAPPLHHELDTQLLFFWALNLDYSFRHCLPSRAIRSSADFGPHDPLA